MTPQELKNSILQLAIQGKLVEQRPEEGTASTLLSHIKIAASVDGQRVKEKTVTAISDNDIPFDIPHNWEWVKLGSVCTIARGGSPRPIKDYITEEENGVNWIKIGDTDKNGKYIYKTAEKIKPSGVSKSRMVHSGDFLLTNSMSFGRPYILKTDGCIHDGWLVISQISEVFDQDYLYWLLSSAFAYSQFSDKVSGAVVKNLNSDKVANSVFPLPPLAEQKRIVAKIEELLPYIDRYEKAWNRLEDFNKRFPADMQKSILQLAIQGKLTEQRPEEDTGEALYQQILKEKQALIKAGKIKKEKSQSENAEKETPFDIPETWKWVDFGTIANILGTGLIRTGSEQYKNAQYYYFKMNNIGNFDGKCIFDEMVMINATDDEYEKYKLEEGDFLFNTRNSRELVGKTAVVPRTKLKIILNNNILKIRLLGKIDPLYMNYYFISPLGRAELAEYVTSTTNVAAIYQKQLITLLVPLPPLAEQKRIVAKLEELLPLCERLK